MLKTWAGFKITMAAPNCSLSDGLGQRLFSFLSLAARISHARHCAAAPFLETNIQSERLNLFKKKRLNVCLKEQRFGIFVRAINTSF